MVYPIYINQIPLSHPQQRVQNWIYSLGEIQQCYWNHLTRYKTLIVKYINKASQITALKQFNQQKINNAKIYSQQVCWACQNGSGTHLIKCKAEKRKNRNIRRCIYTYDISIGNDQQMRNNSKSLENNKIVSNVIDVKIANNQDKNIYAETESTQQKKYSLIIKNKQGRQIKVQTLQKISIKNIDQIIEPQTGYKLRLKNKSKSDIKQKAVKNQNNSQLMKNKLQSQKDQLTKYLRKSCTNPQKQRQKPVKQYSQMQQKNNGQNFYKVNEKYAPKDDQLLQFRKKQQQSKQPNKCVLDIINYDSNSSQSSEDQSFQKIISRQKNF